MVAISKKLSVFFPGNFLIFFSIWFFHRNPELDCSSIPEIDLSAWKNVNRNIHYDRKVHRKQNPSSNQQRRPNQNRWKHDINEQQ